MKSLLVAALLVGGSQWATTKGKTTRLRAEPRNGAPVVVTVPKGTTLHIIGESEEPPYLVVNYEGETVYVHKAWVEIGTDLDGQLSQEEQRPEKRTPPSNAERPELGEGAEHQRFSEIREFLAGAQFHNPEGRLVSSTRNTLHYNDKGADFVSWEVRLITEVKRNWFIPQNVGWQHGHIAVRISIDRSGSLLGIQMLVPSRISSFDEAATFAIQHSRLTSLPADYPDDRFEIIVVFWYNEHPYDLFR